MNNHLSILNNTGVVQKNMYDKKCKIMSSYEYGNQGEKDDAEREYQFISLPPVLHVQLRRFNYNMKTHKSTKNNKHFEFYSKLDLRQYCSQATYTLHSILVHSGTITSGHYMAYICPKSDDQWLKFNDEIVTKCSAQEAIECNYGNGSGSANAYMLVYIKDEWLQQILCDVRMENEAEKNLIEAEIAKEAERLSLQDRHFEVVVFTPEKLQQTESYASGKSLFDSNRGQVFKIDKYQRISDLLQLLVDAFNMTHSDVIRLWMVNEKKATVRFCDTQAISDKMLQNVFKKDRVHLFYELLPVDEALSCSFNKTEHAIIFIKWYDPLNHSLVYFGHRYFPLHETVESVRDFIRGEIGYEDDENNVAIITEFGSCDDYSHRLVRKKEKINRFTSSNGDTSSAIVVFEIVGFERPKFLSMFAASSSHPKPIPSMPTENGIELTINDINEGHELFSKVFEPQTSINGIVHTISEMSNCAFDDIQLLDAQNNQNNVITKDFYTLTLEQYSIQRSTRTRSQKKKGLTFSYKINQTFCQPPAPMEIHYTDDTSSIHGEPMDCQYENHLDSISMEPTYTEDVDKSFMEIPSAEVTKSPSNGRTTVQFHNRTTMPGTTTCEHYRREKMQDILINFATEFALTYNKLEFSDKNGQLLVETHRPLELFLDIDEDVMHIYYEESMVKPSAHSAIDSEQTLMLKFTDRSNRRDNIDLTFEDDNNLSTAIEQVIDVMELDRSNSQFFTSKGKKIGKALLNSKMSNFIKKNSLNISYETTNNQFFELQRVNRKGLEVCKFSYSITESTTIEEICEKSAAPPSRILRMKDGVILGIVSPEVKAIDLLTDGFDYRLDEYKKIWEKLEDPFFICVRFVKNSPEERLKIPLLVEANNGDSLWGFGLRVFQQIDLQAMKILDDFEFEGDNIIANSNSLTNQTRKLIKPDNSNTIPVILLNMNYKGNNRKKIRSSYGYDLENLKGEH